MFSNMVLNKYRDISKKMFALFDLEVDKVSWEIVNNGEDFEIDNIYVYKDNEEIEFPAYGHLPKFIKWLEDGEGQYYDDVDWNTFHHWYLQEHLMLDWDDTQVLYAALAGESGDINL